MPSQPINIDQYIAGLKTALADSVDLALILSERDSSSIPQSRRIDLLCKTCDPSLDLSITPEEAEHANAALDFVTNAKGFLGDAGHPIAFQTFDERDAAEAGLGGFYRPSNSISSAVIRLPIELDEAGNCVITAERGLKIASTMAHEIVHATDDFMYSKETCPPTTDPVSYLNYNGSKNSHALFSFKETLEEHFNSPLAAKQEWEREVSGIFRIDLENPGYSNYKGSFVTELAPRMMEAHLAGRDIISEINGLTPDRQALTHAAIDSFSQKLDSLNMSQELHDISEANNGFLRSYAETTSIAAARITNKTLPEKLDLGDSKEFEALFGKFGDDKASIDISDALESIAAIDEIKKTVQGANHQDEEALKESDTVNKSTAKSAKRTSASRY